MTPFYDDGQATFYTGDVTDVLRALPDESVNCVVTSPPYWGLRDYGVEGQLGLEATPEAYIERMVAVFREVRRVLRKDGTCWVNIGDSYNANTGAGFNGNKRLNEPNRRTVMARPPGLKPKDLVGVPWMLAFALRADGWWLRQDIIWAKPNPMPESVTGSHFTRHRVTIDEYENLSGMRYDGERAGDDWAGDMPSLSESKVPRRKAPLSAKRAWQGYDAGTRRAGGREGEASVAISGDADTASPPSDHRSRTGSEPSGSEHAIRPVADGQGQEPESLRIPKGRTWPGAIHGGGLAGDSGSTQGAMSLLQESQGADDRPRDSGEQGREARQGEYRASLPVLQFGEEGQVDPSLLVGCPGCPKCEEHHGYTFHLWAGRCTKAHEYLFLLTKSATYHYDADAVREPSEKGAAGSRFDQGKTGARDGGDRTQEGYRDEAGRNKRSVWTIATQPYPEAHFATFPEALVEPCVLAGCPEGGIVLDPFLGSGTTALVAKRLGRRAIGIDLSAEYLALAVKRCRQLALMEIECK